jgi:hypothetical protein
MIGPYLLAFDGLQRFFCIFGIVPEIGFQRGSLFVSYLFFTCIDVKDASSGKLFYPSSLVSVPWS